MNLLSFVDDSLNDYDNTTLDNTLDNTITTNKTNNKTTTNLNNNNNNNNNNIKLLIITSLSQTNQLITSLNSSILNLSLQKQQQQQQSNEQNIILLIQTTTNEFIKYLILSYFIRINSFIIINNLLKTKQWSDILIYKPNSTYSIIERIVLINGSYYIGNLFILI